MSGIDAFRRVASAAREVVDRIHTLAWGLARTFRLPPRSIVTTLRVAALMAAVEVLVRRTTLPRVASLLEVRLDLLPSSDPTSPFDLTALTSVEQRQITCTNRVADAWPFSDGPCLRRTLVAGRLLRRRDPSIRIGLRGADMTAHAWLEIDGRPLEDVSDVGAFTVVGAA